MIAVKKDNPDLNNETLGKRIRYFRMRAQLSQFELENLLDISYGTLCRIEKGHVNPTKETLHKIGKALCKNGIEIATLFGIYIDPTNDLIIRNSNTRRD